MAETLITSYITESGIPSVGMQFDRVPLKTSHVAGVVGKTTCSNNIGNIVVVKPRSPGSKSIKEKRKQMQDRNLQFKTMSLVGFLRRALLARNQHPLAHRQWLNNTPINRVYMIWTPLHEQHEFLNPNVDMNQGLEAHFQDLCQAVSEIGACVTPNSSFCVENHVSSSLLLHAAAAVECGIPPFAFCIRRVTVPTPSSIHRNGVILLEFEIDGCVCVLQFYIRPLCSATGTRIIAANVVSHCSLNRRMHCTCAKTTVGQLIECFRALVLQTPADGVLPVVEVYNSANKTTRTCVLRDCLQTFLSMMQDFIPIQTLMV